LAWQSYLSYCQIMGLRPLRSYLGLHLVHIGAITSCYAHAGTAQHVQIRHCNASGNKVQCLSTNGFLVYFRQPFDSDQRGDLHLATTFVVTSCQTQGLGAVSGRGRRICARTLGFSSEYPLLIPTLTIGGFPQQLNFTGRLVGRVVTQMRRLAAS
jgi:hypothetical protein